MTFPKFKCQDDATRYVMNQVNHYITEHYSPILISDGFYKKFLLNNNAFYFDTYSENAMESYLTFHLNSMLYDEKEDAYFYLSQADQIDKKLELGYFAGWDENTFKKIFNFVDKCVQIAIDSEVKGYTYYDHPKFKKVN